jgi:hypothetical protein
LSCGCVGGAYQTYDDRIAHLLDVPARTCTHPSHRAGKSLTGAELLSLYSPADEAIALPSDRPEPFPRIGPSND